VEGLAWCSNLAWNRHAAHVFQDDLRAGRLPRTFTHMEQHHRRECDMAKKGYWIGHVNITNPERYKDYIAANAAAFRKYGARFLVRNGESQVPEGGLTGRRHVVIEFDSYETAKACYNSPEYRAAIEIRREASTGDLIVIEGYEG
jgi:uncharacterized protein (DUF1330 family)